MGRKICFAMYVVTWNEREFDWEDSQFYSKPVRVFRNKGEAIKCAKYLRAKDIEKEKENGIEYEKYIDENRKWNTFTVGYRTFEKLSCPPRDITYTVSRLWLPLSKEEASVIEERIQKELELFPKDN